ncbi:MAG: ribosomal protein S18-alanine N-acetyltransferase [Bdellovibrionia bacterium]
MQVNDWSLRPATTEDLSKILQIENQVHVSPWTEEHFRAEFTKPYSQFYVLTDDESDSQMAGYIVCWMLFDECQILNVAVDLPFRGLGLAKLMVRKMMMFAQNKGVNKMILEVRKSNMPAIQLYQSLGFTIQHIFKGFYSSGEDAYQMTASFLESHPHF